MKLKKQILALGLAVGFASIGGSAFAAGPNHTITVNATVPTVCKFSSTTSSVTLALDPTLTTTVTGTDNVLYRCTNGTAPTFTLTSSSTSSTTGGNLAQGAETIPYTFTSTSGGPGTGLGSGNDKTLGVTVSVDQTNAASVTPGTYSDTIVVSVNP